MALFPQQSISCLDIIVLDCLTNYRLPWPDQSCDRVFASRSRAPRTSAFDLLSYARQTALPLPALQHT